MSLTIIENSIQSPLIQTYTCSRLVGLPIKSARLNINHFNNLIIVSFGNWRLSIRHYLGLPKFLESLTLLNPNLTMMSFIIRLPMARRNLPTNGYIAIEIKAMIVVSKTESPKSLNRTTKTISVNSLLSNEPKLLEMTVYSFENSMN
mgnify:CR=1 FL=1